jgi:hypothetical protein
MFSRRSGPLPPTDNRGRRVHGFKPFEFCDLKNKGVSNRPGNPFLTSFLPLTPFLQLFFPLSSSNYLRGLDPKVFIRPRYNKCQPIHEPTTMSTNMSQYSFLLHTCNLGTKTRTVVNPFTKQQFEVPIDKGLTEGEVEAIWTIFQDHQVTLIELIADENWATYANEQAKFRCLDLNGPTPIDSIHAELTVPQITNEMLEMILAMASGANLALTSNDHKCVRIAGRHPNSMELARWPDAKKLSSVAELRQWLQNDISG